MTVTHYLPTPLSADEAQVVTKLEKLSGLSKQTLLRDLVSAALARVEARMEETGAHQVGAVRAVIAAETSIRYDR